MAINRKRWLYLILTLVALLIIGLGSIINSLLWGGDFLVFKVNSSVTVVDKIRSAEKQGGNVELSDADFNALLELSLKNKTQAGALVIKGMFAHLGKGTLTMCVPVSYHGLALLISSSGELQYSESGVIFHPKIIKVGKLHLPIGFLAKEISKFSIAGATVEDNGDVQLPKEVFPFNFKNLFISEAKLVLVMEKVTPPTESVSVQPVPSPSNSTNSNSNSRVELFKRAKSQLAGVYGSVKTAQEKAIIGQIQSVVAKMVNDPNYPYLTEAQSVKTQYNRLSAEEKSDIKDAILDNMDTGTLREIKGTFSL